MCDRLIHFHRKTKAPWRRLGPSRIGLGRVRAGKRRVDLRAVQHAGVAGQVTPRMREFSSRRARRRPASGAYDDHFVESPITSTTKTPVTIASYRRSSDGDEAPIVTACGEHRASKHAKALRESVFRRRPRNCRAIRGFVTPADFPEAEVATNLPRYRA